MTRPIRRDDLPDWVDDLQRELCDQISPVSYAGPLHPQEITDVVVRFLLNRGIV